jgi:predicted ATP-dependent serine protease
MGLESGDFPRPLSPNPNNNRGRYDLKLFLETYRRNGLVVLPLLPRSKQCVIENWQNLTVEELLQHFRPDSNLGIRLDSLIAIDIERPQLWPVLTELSIEAMSRKTWIQKTGKGYHILFRGEAKPFKVDGLAEIRSGSSQYIVVAPSIHPDTGKPYQWISDIRSTPIADLDRESLSNLKHKLEILRRFKKFIEAMIECWKRYHRHNLSLWISGVFRKIGLSLEDAGTVLKAITYLSCDEEISDRLRALEDTYRKDNSEVKGWSGLREELIEITGSVGEAEKVLKLLPIHKGLLFEVKSLKELVEGAREISYIAKPILPRGALVLFTGRGGVGKSLLSLYMAHHIANGKPLFNYFDASPSKVLIVDNENTPTVYRDRVESLSLNPIDSIDIINLTNFRLDRKGAIAKLKTLVTTNSYEVVFIDNWTTITSRVDENKSNEVSNILTRLRKLAYETNCTIILLHHIRKSLPYSHSIDEVRGSSVLVNEVDLVLLLEKGAAPNERIVRTLKNRLGEEFAFRLNLRYDEEGVLNIEYAGEIEEALDSNIIKAANEIKTFMQMVHIAKRKEIFEAMKGYSESTIKRAINYLLAVGELKRDARGIYTIKESLEGVI